jgi:hypothetical protein
MNNNDVTMNTSINIYNELLKMYNNSFNFNKSTIVEPFSLPHVNGRIPDSLRSDYIEDVIRLKHRYGYEINFTIEELENVLKNLESRAISLTFKQQEERKKIIINLKDILISEKIKEIKDDLIKHYLEDPNNPIDGTQKSILNKQNIKENVNGLHALLLNVVDLFIEDIENISIKENLEKENIKLKNINKESENKINNNNIITIILVILLVIVIIFYIKK